MAEPDPRLDMEAIAIRATMRDRIGHAVQGRNIDRTAIVPNKAGDAAHFLV
jgi:hypothetical protein